MLNNSHTALPIATAIIHGREMQAIFDSGATQSVIGLRHIQENKIPFKPSKDKCKLGNSASVDILGITEAIEVTVFGTIWKLKFLILPRYNVLLGCDWNKMLHASVQTYNNTLIFGQREIKLSPHEGNFQNIFAVDISDAAV